MDKEILWILKKWKKESKYKGPIMFKIDRDRNTLVIFVSRPGILIGYHGEYSFKYIEKIKEKIPRINDVELKEVSYYYA